MNNNNNKTQILCNAFSLQMVNERNLSRVRFEAIEAPNPNEIAEMHSAIGHTDTAAVLGVDMNRINVQLSDDTELIVAQLSGGRLLEGSTTLPEGYSFTWVRVYLA